MELSREGALRLHRAMWSDMRRNLGNNPSQQARRSYKEAWIIEHFGRGTFVLLHCFLCEYAGEGSICPNCSKCPIVWGEEESGDFKCEHGEVDWRNSPITRILGLPEREIKE